MQHHKQQQHRSDRNRRKDVEKFMERVRRQRRGVFIRSTIEQLSQGPETLEATERKRMRKKEKEGERESREWRGIICMYL